VEQHKAVIEAAGATLVIIDPTTVNVAMIVPAMSVRVISSTLPINIDVVLPGSDRAPLDQSPATVLNMGIDRGTTNKETIKVPYPSVRDAVEADSVRPKTSPTMQSNTTAMNVILAESLGAPGTNSGEVSAASIKRATLTPPRCMAAYNGRPTLNMILAIFWTDCMLNRCDVCA